MQFICDVHVPVKLSKHLVSLGAQSQHVNQILEGSSTPDELICTLADTTDSIVITKDSDFKNSYFVRGTPRKLIRVCLGNLPNDKLIQLMEKEYTFIEKLNEEKRFYAELREESLFVFR